MRLLKAVAVSILAMVGFPSPASALHDLSVNPSSAAPGETVTISGSCADPPVGTLDSVDLEADTGETDSAPPGPGGAFAFQYEVAAGADPRTITFTVTCYFVLVALPLASEANTVTVQVTAGPRPTPPPTPPLPTAAAVLDVTGLEDFSGPAIPITRVPRFTG